MKIQSIKEQFSDKIMKMPKHKFVYPGVSESYPGTRIKYPDPIIRILWIWLDKMIVNKKSTRIAN